MTDTLDAISDKLKTLTSAAQFSDSVGKHFRASWGTEESVELELLSATAVGHGPRKGDAREPFSLIFRADNSETYLAQGIYKLEDESRDALHLFLVPIGPDDVGMRFEAVFN